ncbi:Cytochrome B5-like protein [Zea mays]|uniref:Cytochrome B5-like protein n=2 Tax=Zea mays TaxID=4577 RepID=A0A8J8Y9M0_MAIZE|nr:Cytochrome b5 [Zea mays]PWZ58804.1 Cytochrome B5-like protein [Zea mays]
MDIIIIISLVILLALGALFVIPKSQNKGKSKRNDLGAGTVYDVTPYVEEHPGGDAILNNAGGDSTEGFFGFLYDIPFFWIHRPQHGTRVFDIIEDFCIGQLKAS